VAWRIQNCAARPLEKPLKQLGPCVSFYPSGTLREVCWMASQVRDTLLASNDEFRRLVQEHTQYSQRLESLLQKRFLSDDEKVEEVRLKKLKLRLKDQMENIEQQFKRQHQVA
jgi:uncharacterized protein YdcH (DUF465 family)